MRTTTSRLGLRRVMGIEFSDQQIDAIVAPLEPGVIVAGAGSGKTTVMAARAVWLVATGKVRADQVLGLTFTNKAASELSRRVRDFLADAGLGHRPGSPVRGQDELAEPTVMTYHAYAARLLTEHGLRIGHEPDTRLIADASRFQLAVRAIRTYEHPIQHLTTWMPTNVNAVLHLDAQMSEHLVSPDAVRGFQVAEIERWRAARQTNETRKAVTALEQRRELLDLVDGYRRVKKRLAAMDFSDQMALGAQLAESCPEVGAAERDRFRVVLLDEYQDTSVAQARLLTALFSGADQRLGRGHPVTAVGDPCQAIYGWRGASVSNIEQFGADFPRIDGEEVSRFPLSVNLRSDSRILQVANELAGELYTAHVDTKPLESKPAAELGTVRAALLETYQDELEFLAREVPAAFAAMSAPRWSDIGVLVRDNKSAGDVHDVLTANGVPVEVVGLSGLLRMSEVADVVATLQVLHDVTANASLLALLAGPRWAIGARDLAMLGRRARLLAQGTHAAAGDVAGKLEEAVAGVDPADFVSLVEAVEDPGTQGYSTAALQRFKQLSRELRALRRFVGEPLLDLVRRVIDVTGLDVELASSTSGIAAARRDNLSTFLDAISAFAGIDGDASLSGLLAYLAAEDEYGQGLALAVPTQANSVKLLTVHRAKGMEWDVVFLPGMCHKLFPSAQGRSRWPTTMAELPSPLRGDCVDLPKLGAASAEGLKVYAEECREYELLEERRLGYVAVTRPRRQLVVSCHWWGPEQKLRRGPSEFFSRIVETMRAWGQDVQIDTPAPDDIATNPSNRAEMCFPWPVETGADEVGRRQEAAALVAGAHARGVRDAVLAADAELMLDEIALVQQWDAELVRLLEEASASRTDEVVVTLPPSLSATALLRLKHDPAGLARELARPMPRRPSAVARFGTRFHAWVETHVGRQQQLLEPGDLPGRADLDIQGDVELDELIAAFEAGPYATRAAFQVEAPFALVLGGRVVRGRIDAVYATDDGFQVVDWKTNRQHDADPIQLAVYRLAWAELRGVEIERVTAAFYYVRSGDVVSPVDLPGRDELEQLVTGESAGEAASA